MGSVLFRVWLLDRLYTTFARLDRRGLDRVGCRRTTQDVSPAVAALPECGVTAEQADSHSKHWKEKPRLIDARGDVDAGAPGRDRSPARELAANLLDDLRLTRVRNNFLAPLGYAPVPVSA